MCSSCPKSPEDFERFAHANARRDDYDGTSNGTGIDAKRGFTYLAFFGGAQIAMIVFAVILVLFCALLSGLTLAVCGLDINYLQLRSITGSAHERRQAKEIIRMKRHASWMLCSLILCSVGCSQMFPFVIQSVWHGKQVWVPLLISTVTMTIFVELIPQYFIPQQAIAWGYYCWPVIWGCMWTSCLITYPLGWLLDRLRTKKDRVGIFTNDELRAVIQYHEQAEKRGGKLGQDAARIMLGALKLDSQSLGGDKKPTPQAVRNEQDVEKADSVANEGIIVSWSAVKTIDINDTVDEAFVKKVQSWSYSRIPVVGKETETTGGAKESKTEGWEGNKVFGFLHMKNLVGISTKVPAKVENKLKVKDLTLYPLPIVRADMSVYELLNLFQMGMSRMAIVVRESSAASNGNTGSTLWTATERRNTHLVSSLKGVEGKSHSTMDYLKFAQAAAVDHDHPRQDVLGIECPMPLGMITFEDIIDTILQKTSRDEKDFFDRDSSCPPTKTKKVGDYSSKLGGLTADQNQLQPPKRARVTFEKSVNSGTLRKRKVSRKASGPGGFDGADDCSFDGNYASSIRLPKNRRKSTGSSYTDNSGGGFHGVNDPESSIDHAIVMTAQEIIELANTSSSACPGNPYSHTKPASLPTPTCRSDGACSEDSKGFKDISANPRLPQIRRVAPFSRDNPSSFEREAEDQEGSEMTELTMPIPLITPGPFPGIDFQLRYNPNISSIGIEDMVDPLEPTEVQAHVRKRSGETMSLMSWSSDDDARQMTCVYDAVPVTACENKEQSLLSKDLNAASEEKAPAKPYDGFPAELLETTKENRPLDYSSKTLPRSIGTRLTLEGFKKIKDATPRARESSFHDDRALLPSQRRLLEDGSTGLGTRSSSLWF